MTTTPRARQPQNRDRRPSSPHRRRREPLISKEEEINYKDAQLMRRFVSERGKIAGARSTRLPSKLRRRVAVAIKRARHLALIPIAPNHAYLTNPVQTAAGTARPAKVTEAPALEQKIAEEKPNEAEDQAPETEEASPSSKLEEKDGVAEERSTPSE